MMAQSSSTPRRPSTKARSRLDEVGSKGQADRSHGHTQKTAGSHQGHPEHPPLIQCRHQQHGEHQAGDHVKGEHVSRDAHLQQIARQHHQAADDDDLDAGGVGALLPHHLPQQHRRSGDDGR